MKKIMLRVLPVIGFILFLSGCLEFVDIDQPDSVRSGRNFKVVLEVKTTGVDVNPYHGIIAFKIPVDWEVRSVKMRGDYGRDTFEHLPAGTPDKDPGGKVDFWEETLERIFESDRDMHWVVYQTEDRYPAEEEVAFADVTIEFKAGEPGEYEIDYFVSDGALDLSDPGFYGIEQGLEIEVK